MKMMTINTTSQHHPTTSTSSDLHSRHLQHHHLIHLIVLLNTHATSATSSSLSTRGHQQHHHGIRPRPNAMTIVLSQAPTPPPSHLLQPHHRSSLTHYHFPRPTSSSPPSATTATASPPPSPLEHGEQPLLRAPSQHHHQRCIFSFKLCSVLVHARSHVNLHHDHHLHGITFSQRPTTLTTASSTINTSKRGSNLDLCHPPSTHAMSTKLKEERKGGGNKGEEEGKEKEREEKLKAEANK